MHLRDVDQLGDFDGSRLAGGGGQRWRRSGGGGRGLAGLTFHPPYQATAGCEAGGVVFFTSTRNALYSGVLTLASPTDGVSVFDRMRLSRQAR